MATIITRPDNTRKPHTVRWRDESGRQRERSFATKREASDWRKRVEYEVRAGIFTDPKLSGLAFAEYARGVVDGLAVSEGTLRAYRGILSGWIEPWAHGRTLRQVAEDREGLQDLVNNRMRDDAGKLLSYNRRGSARTIVLAAADEAVRAGRLSTHRLGGIRIVRADTITERRDFVFPSYALISALAVLLGALGMAVWLCRGAGLRAREALAVEKRDFRDNGAVLRVARQSSINGDKAVPLKHRRAGQFRDVPVPSWLWELVKGLPDGPLCPTGNGRPYVSYSVFYKAFTREAKGLGIPAGFVIHSLRHAYATALLTNGVQLHEVSQWLGHKSTEITSRIYAHVLPSALGRARSVLDDEYTAWKANATVPDVRKND